jgi:hypothetical protein
MKFKGSPGDFLQLELNSEVLAGPVGAYIIKKMSDLQERYKREWELAGGITPKAEKIICDTLGTVTEKMQQKAGGTFLWVYLIFHRIKDE